MRVLFILLLLVSVNAFASDVYQASGVLQYQANGQPMIAKPFSIGTFSDIGSCNSEVANQNNLYLQDTPNPSGTKVNAAQKVDAICYPVLPVQQPGYWIVGTGQVQQGNVAPQPIDTKIGPFATSAICEAKLLIAKGLKLQNTPKSGNNVGYGFNGDCVFLLSTSY